MANMTHEQAAEAGWIGVEWDFVALTQLRRATKSIPGRLVQFVVSTEADLLAAITQYEHAAATAERLRSAIDILVAAGDENEAYVYARACGDALRALRGDAPAPDGGREDEPWSCPDCGETDEKVRTTSGLCRVCRARGIG